MNIELTVVEDLGIKLYSKLPQVLAEMVANAWDANASAVEISLQEGDIGPESTIVVSDDGHGMAYDEIGDKYLRVGRKRRDTEGDKTEGDKRNVMGRKGIGKLSVFGIAKRAEIRTVREGRLSVFLMDVDKMLSQAREEGKYKPDLLAGDKEVDERDGTTITLTSLTRKTSIDVQSVRRGIAKHFAVMGDEFCVSVNGEQITPAEKFVDAHWDKKWEIKEPVASDRQEWVVSGWIGAAKSPLAEEDRGVAITARGKLIQSPTTFGIKSGSRYSYSYLAGEIRAEFCDMEEDSIATDRHSIVDTQQGVALREWGAAKISKISEELVSVRRTAREKTIREDPEIKAWLDTLDGQQMKMANKIIGIVTLGENMDHDKRKELIRYARASFEQSTFLEMLSTMEENPDSATLLDMFREYNVVEARELERIVKARLETINRLDKFMQENATEVPTMHDYFKNAPWMLDPTWTQWQDEVYFSQLLKEKFPNEKLEESNRRIDFMAIGVGDTVHVIELKRPRYRLRSSDFAQLASYVGFVKNRIGNDPNGYKSVAGYLVVGARSDDSGVREMTQTYENSRYYIRTYGDLVSSARRLHKHFDDKLEDFEKARLQAKL